LSHRADRGGDGVIHKTSDYDYGELIVAVTRVLIPNLAVG